MTVGIEFLTFDALDQHTFSRPPMGFSSTLFRRSITSFVCLVSALVAGCGGGGGGEGTISGTPQPSATVLQVISIGAATSGPTSQSVEGALNVDPSIALLVTFNEAVKSAGLGASAFVLVGNGQQTEVAVNVGTTSAILVPQSPLEVGTSYTLTVKAGIGAQNGTVLANDYTTGFTTAPVAYKSVVLAAPDPREGYSAPRLVAVGDLNGDGRADVVQLGDLPFDRSSPGRQGYSLRLFTQSSDGSFGLLQEIDTVMPDTSGMTFPKVFVTDIDGDGIPEILVPEHTLEGLKGDVPGAQVSGVRIYKRNSAGLYAASDFVPTNYTQSVTMLDVDGDGRLDLIGTSIYQPGFQVIFNTGAGLKPTEAVSDAYCTCEFAVADLNRDGKRQLIVNNVGQILPTTFATVAPSISAYTVNASGQLLLDTAITQSLSAVCSGFDVCQSLVILDINRDGLPDLFVGLASTSNGDSVAFPYIRNSAGGYTQGAQIPYAGRMMPVDVNLDGVLDMVFITVLGDTNVAAVLFVQGDGTFRPSPAFPIPEGETLPAGAIAIADINGDGRPDIVLTGVSEGVTAMLQIK